MSEKTYTASDLEAYGYLFSKFMLDQLADGKKLNTEQLTAKTMTLIQKEASLPANQNLEEKYKRIQSRSNPSKMDSIKNLIS